MNFDDKVLDRLHNSKDFLFFIEQIKLAREAAIMELHSRKTEELQYLAGRICQADDVLDMAKYDALKAKWSQYS